jgi:hypothetical protein
MLGGGGSRNSCRSLETSLYQHSRRHYLLLDVPLQYLHEKLA